MAKSTAPLFKTKTKTEAKTEAEAKAKAEASMAAEKFDRGAQKKKSSDNDDNNDDDNEEAGGDHGHKGGNFLKRLWRRVSDRERQRQLEREGWQRL